MKKNCCLLFSLLSSLVLSYQSFAQTPPSATKNIEWQKCLGGSKNDTAMDVLLNADGSIIVVGSSQSNDGNVSGHHGSLDTTDAWIVKLDARGNILWQKSIGGTGFDKFNKVIATADGNYLCVGSTTSTDGDILLSNGYNNGQEDVFVVKVSANGNIIWSQCFGGSLNDYADDATTTSDGGFAIIAVVRSFDGYVQSKTYSDTRRFNWIFKLDSLGNLLWENAINLYNIDESFPDYNNAWYYDSVNDVYIINDSTYNTGHGIIETPSKTLMVLTEGYSADSEYIQLANGGPEAGYIYEYHHPGLLTSLNENTGQAISSFLIPGDGSFSISKTSDRFFVSGNLARSEITNEGYFCFDSLVSAYSEKFDESSPFGIFSSNGFSPCVNNGNNTNSNYSIALHGITTLTDSVNSAVGGFTTEIVSNGYSVYYIGPYDAWLSKFGSVGGTGDDYFKSAKYLSNGNEIVAVGYTNSKDGDVSGLHGSAGGPYDCWIVKFANKNKITGNVFLDKNNNGVQDAGEPGFDDAKIQSVKNGVAQYAIPNNGAFTNIVDTGTYTTTLVINKPYYTTTNSGKTSIFSSYGSSDSVNFPVHPVSGISDYAVAITALEPASPNLDIEYVITYSNKGTDTLKNKTLYFIKDGRSQFGYSVPAPSVISGDTLFWTVNNITPDSSSSIKFYLKLDAIPQLTIGDTLISTVFIDSIHDASPADNLVMLRQLVVGSIDPNDKEETHGGFITPDEMTRDEYLTYTIRFQNKGNETVSNIIVRDTLDNALNGSSIQMVASSNPYQFNIQNGKYLTWTFNNINLPDSAANDSLSKGYIGYQIKPLLGFVTGDTIRNSAAIYFDYNPAVETNTQVTAFTAEKDVWTGTTSKVWENPSNWLLLKVPDSGVDVYINAGAINYPEINSQAACRTIYVNPSASIKIITGNLNVGGLYIPH